MKEANKSIYRKWSEKNSKLPLFFYPFWLDAVCGEKNWDVALVRNANERVEGVMPFVKRRRMGLPWSDMPMLTPYLGPFLIYPAKVSQSQMYTFEKKIMNRLIDQLPSYFYFQQNWLPEAVNWLPFYWKGYKQTTYYTYTFKDISKADRLFNGFKSATRNHIRVASRSYSIEETETLDEFYELNRITFKSQGNQIPYSLDFFETLDQPLREKGWCKIYLARSTEKKQIEGGIYIARDNNKAYLLASGRLPQSQSGVISLLIWHALKKMSKEVRQFDFEGSIIPGIETFFRSFGAELTPYYQVYKGKNNWIELLKLMASKRPK